MTKRIKNVPQFKCAGQASKFASQKSKKTPGEKVEFIFDKTLDFLSLLWYVVVLTEKEAQHEENN